MASAENHTHIKLRTTQKEKKVKKISQLLSEEEMEHDTK